MRTKTAPPPLPATPALNSDNSHCGPYTKDGATAIADGDITDELDIMIDPLSMEVGEKFALSVSINDAAGAYKTELLVNFFATGSKSVAIAIGMAPEFKASLTEAGVYTLKYRYYDNEGKLFAEFAVEKDGEVVAKAEAIDMKVNTADCGKRGYIWFSDISVDGGLRVGTPAVQDAPVLLPGDWVTEGGYGSAEKKSENLVILKGEAELNSDNSHCGPVIKNPGLLEDGTLVDELYVYLDPAELEHAEKFVLTAGLNNTSDAYVDEFAVMFQKSGEAINVTAGVAPGFTGALTEAGMYTLRYTFSLANDAVLGCFTVLKGDEEVASTGNVVMPTATPDNTKGRRYLWFCDISVDGGLAVYSDPNADYTAVDAAIAKAEALKAEDYEDFSAVTAAIKAVVRGKTPPSRRPLTRWPRPSRTPSPPSSRSARFRATSLRTLSPTPPLPVTSLPTRLPPATRRTCCCGAACSCSLCSAACWSAAERSSNR